MNTLDKRSLPFLGASAPWIDDEEASYEHTLRQVADFLRLRLQQRVAVLNSSHVTAEDVSLEIRRQMAECAVDGNLVLVSDLSEGLLALLSLRDDRRSL